jgi:MoaA/NifB/PqqE/SkfB family radical SAM enzyme
MNINKKSLLHEPIVKALDAAIANDRLRAPVLRVIERKAYRAFLGENAGSSPDRTKEDKFYMIRSAIHAVDRAYKNKTMSGSVRKGLRCYIQNVMLEGGKDIAGEFEKEHGFKPPGFVTISPGKRCNLHCTGCYAGSSDASAPALSFEVFDRIMEEKKKLWGSYFTVISGGEPLLYSSDGKDIFDIARKHSDNFFLMYTNGTLIDEKMAERFAEVGNITPAISIEGFEKETDERRGKGVHKKILRAFANLRNVGVPFGVSMTATRDNAEVLLSDELIDYYSNEQGALYGWIFQYMPIGRSFTLDMMVTPQQRLRMFRRMWSLVKDRGLFIADFWNSGTATYGCISAGRGSGYFYIEWNGNVTPCVFNPYSVHNINDVYANGGDLNTVLFSPFMKGIREWQDNYCLKRAKNEVGNLMRPCPIRDHYAVMRKLIEDCGASPTDENAEEALKDEEYQRGLTAYGEEIEKLTGDIWKKEYLANDYEIPVQ